MEEEEQENGGREERESGEELVEGEGQSNKH